jgi:multiple sugar transport system permease protein
MYNYVAFFQDTLFWNAMKNTLVFVISAVSLELILGLVLASGLNRVIRGSGFFRSILLMPMFITPVAVGLIFRFMLPQDIGIIPCLLGKIGLFNLDKIEWLASPSTALVTIILIDVWQWTSFVTLFLLAGLQSLPEEPFEAARVDGASGYQIFRYITLPLMTPVIMVTILLRMIDAFRVFEYVYVLTRGGPGAATETITYYIYKVGFRFFYLGKASAMALLFMSIIMVIAVLQMKISQRRSFE